MFRYADVTGVRPSKANLSDRLTAVLRQEPAAKPHGPLCDCTVIAPISHSVRGCPRLIDHCDFQEVPRKNRPVDLGFAW